MHSSTANDGRGNSQYRVKDLWRKPGYDLLGSSSRAYTSYQAGETSASSGSGLLHKPQQLFRKPVINVANNPMFDAVGQGPGSLAEACIPSSRRSSSTPRSRNPSSPYPAADTILTASSRDYSAASYTAYEPPTPTRSLPTCPSTSSILTHSPGASRTTSSTVNIHSPATAYPSSSSHPYSTGTPYGTSTPSDTFPVRRTSTSSGSFHRASSLTDAGTLAANLDSIHLSDNSSSSSSSSSSMYRDSTAATAAAGLGTGRRPGSLSGSSLYGSGRQACSGNEGGSGGASAGGAGAQRASLLAAAAAALSLTEPGAKLAAAMAVAQGDNDGIKHYRSATSAGTFTNPKTSHATTTTHPPSPRTTSISSTTLDRTPSSTYPPTDPALNPRIPPSTSSSSFRNPYPAMKTPSPASSQSSVLTSHPSGSPPSTAGGMHTHTGASFYEAGGGPGSSLLLRTGTTSQGGSLYHTMSSASTLSATDSLGIPTRTLVDAAAADDLHSQPTHQQLQHRFSSSTISTMDSSLCSSFSSRSASSTCSSPSDSPQPPCNSPLHHNPAALLPKGGGSRGLQNLGNTCFMNSILQSLNTVPDLVLWFLQEKMWKAKATVAPAFSSLLLQMWSRSGRGAVDPSTFLRRVSGYDSRWGEGRQHDSQEFLHSLLEALQADCNRVVGKPAYRELTGAGPVEQQAWEAEAYARSWHDSIVDDLFGGLLQSTLQCQKCQQESHCFDPFLDLSLPIPTAKGASVQDCLKAFVVLEKLDPSEAYRCGRCKAVQAATKKLQVWRPPRCLVLTLKRFSQSQNSILSRIPFASKNSAPVSISTQPLDLTPYCNPEGLAQPGTPRPIYQLTAISHHSGSLAGGHYTAVGRNASDGRWHHFNDSHVREESTPPSGPSSTAYVLFYQLVSAPSSSL